MKTNLLILILVLTAYQGFSQDSLDSDQLLSEVLKNAFGLRIAELNVSIAETQNDIGNAGLLPSLNVSAGGTYSNNNAELTIIGQPQPIEVSGAEATQLNAGLNLNYTLFNGFSGKNTLKRLQVQEDLADVNKRTQVELVIANSLSAYYSAAGLQRSLKAAKQSLEISRERMERAQLKYEYGGQSKLEYLSAQVDYSNDSVAYLNASLALNQAKRQLNYLMAKEEQNTDFVLSEAVFFSDMADISELKSRSKENSSIIRNAKMNLLLAEQDLKIARSSYYPRIDINAGYNYVNSENEAGVLSQQITFGLNTGVSLSYNLFAANRRKINAEVAQLRLQSQMIQEEDARLQTNRDLENAWDIYQTRKSLVEIEANNLKTAELNFQRADELYRLGGITNVQFRDAQLNLLRSRIRSIQTRYDLKLAEIEILRISGELMKN